MSTVPAFPKTVVYAPFWEFSSILELVYELVGQKVFFMLFKSSAIKPIEYCIPLSSLSYQWD